jgi:hypothetical protein
VAEVERLRNIDKRRHELSNEVVALRAEVERLRVKANEYETTALHLQEERAEVERLRGILESERVFARQVADHRDEYAAEVERLRAALERIRDEEDSVDWCVEIARNALAEEKV